MIIHRMNKANRPRHLEETRKILASNLKTWFFFPPEGFTGHSKWVPGGSGDKVSARKVGDLDSIPGWGRSGEGDGYPLQDSCLENSIDREAWWAKIHGVTKSQHNLGSERQQPILHKLESVFMVLGRFSQSPEGWIKAKISFLM